MKLSRTLLAITLAASTSTADIELPAETATLKFSTLPGYEVATQKCVICHSADYINLQPPGMSLNQWTSELVKMQHAYGAPIDDQDIKLIAIYVTATYGDPTTISGDN
jgi:cytochrome c